MASDYARVARAIQFIEANAERQPDLQAMARHVGLGPHRFQRLFTRWAGISPKRFLQVLTLDHARQLLDQSRSVLQAAHGAGLSGPGRLHDLFVTIDAVTPGEYKRQGAGLTIRHGVHSSPFGPCLVASTGRGICGLAFIDAGGERQCLRRLARRWSRARLQPDPQLAADVIERAFSRGADAANGSPTRLHLQGTNHQVQVWQALLEIPPGMVLSYGDLATRIGNPGAAIAVGQALAKNPVAYLIPCHRVLRADGRVGGYRWGRVRKRALLAWESGRRGSGAG
jgi:AraC family transcriptional regulator of adaptative response/methylated-DNA-[protein]-cysteine methyltransferase